MVKRAKFSDFRATDISGLYHLYSILSPRQHSTNIGRGNTNDQDAILVTYAINKSAGTEAGLDFSVAYKR